MLQTRYRDEIPKSTIKLAQILLFSGKVVGYCDDIVLDLVYDF